MARENRSPHPRRLLLRSTPLLALPVWRASHAELSQSDAGSGVRALLEKGAVAAVESLGVETLGTGEIGVVMLSCMPAVCGQQQT